MPKHPDRVSCWEPTPAHILDEALRFAQISSKDTLFDLGSGDGVVLVRAAELYGCKSIGMEITDKLIDKTIRRANRLGVKRLVSVRKKDMRKGKYKNASVVYMYLPDGAVNKMFPILKKQCKKGTKIVTVGSNHVSGLPKNKDLKPYKHLHIELPDRFWNIRMWIV